MNPLKHMELIFGVIVVAALLTAAMPERSASAAARRASTVATQFAEAARHADAAPARSAMPVVVIKGKRLNPREKRRSALTFSAVADPVKL